MPVVILEDIEGVDARLLSDRSEATGEGQVPDAEFSAPMQFQAAGWFEPDPLPIRATALIDGVVEEVHVLEGASVSKGDPLASLIADDVELRLLAAKRDLAAIEAEHHMHLAMIPAVKAEGDSLRSQIAAANAKLEEVEDSAARIGRLSKGTVSEQEVKAAQSTVASHRAKVAALEADLAAKLAQLESINTQSAVFDARIDGAKVKIQQEELARSRVDIVSPVDGVVLELKAAPGQKKMLGMDDVDSATVAVLFETGKLQARVDVPLADAGDLVPGKAAIITTDFLPNVEFRGRVTRIVGAADLQRNTLQAKVRVIDPDPRLRPDMLCRVKFLRSSYSGDPSSPTKSDTLAGEAKARALFVPSAALFAPSEGEASVWAVSPDGSRSIRKQIAVGDLEIDGHTLVRQGLLAGEKVILPPHDRLSDGRRINPSESEL